jgi:hypothetical protein
MNSKKYISSGRAYEAHQPRHRRHKRYVRVTGLEMLMNPVIAIRVFASYCAKIYTNWQYLNRYRMFYPM